MVVHGSSYSSRSITLNRATAARAGTSAQPSRAATETQAGASDARWESALPRRREIEPVTVAAGTHDSAVSAQIGAPVEGQVGGQEQHGEKERHTGRAGEHGHQRGDRDERQDCRSAGSRSVGPGPGRVSRSPAAPGPRTRAGTGSPTRPAARSPSRARPAPPRRRSGSPSSGTRFEVRWIVRTVPHSNSPATSAVPR